MASRFTSIYIRYLKPEWWLKRQPSLQQIPFVLAMPLHGRLVVSAMNHLAEKEGIFEGMVVADARAIFPGIEVIHDDPQLEQRLLQKIAEWCIRFTPHAAVDIPNGIILDSTGCAHLWKDEQGYANEIRNRLKDLGYQVAIGIADTIGAAWAAARYSAINIIEPGEQANVLRPMPPAALRIAVDISEKLSKLGLHSINDLLSIPFSSLQKRFGQHLVLRMRQALGEESEIITPVHETDLPQERLYSLDPISTAAGIKIAISTLLQNITVSLQSTGWGIRSASLFVYTIDGLTQEIKIGTNRASNNPDHLRSLFEEKIPDIDPGLGIELFRLIATHSEKLQSFQTKYLGGHCSI